MVAVSLLVTIVMVLFAERRRRTAEARSMAVALGAEFRAVARRAFAVHSDVLKLLPPVNHNLVAPPRTLRDLQSVVHFPEVPIFAGAGAGVAALGGSTFLVVTFYQALWALRDEVASLWQSSAVERQMVSVPSSQLLDTAQRLLLIVVEAATALPQIKGGRDRAGDEAFLREVSSAQERLAVLRQSFSFRP